MSRSTAKSRSLTSMGARVPSMIRWDGEKTLWHTEQGITLGTRLKELERLNGRPFTLTGFDWDYGGTVTNWNGGKLAEQIPDMILRLTPDYDETDTQLTEAEAHAVLGDQEITSDNPIVQRLNPAVRIMLKSFLENRPEDR